MLDHISIRQEDLETETNRTQVKAGLAMVKAGLAMVKAGLAMVKAGLAMVKASCVKIKMQLHHRPGEIHPAATTE